jgi:two-component system NtrC family sensor kinase
VHGIAFTFDEVEEGAVVRADPAQLQQVLINLLNNAMDAIIDRRGTSGGRLSVAVRLTDLGEVKIEVVDNGSGIRPENLEKVFSPFFTTKPVGKGTGLGLSVCYGIVNGMGGSMEVASELGKGTTFTVRLPLAGRQHV